MTPNMVSVVPSSGGRRHPLLFVHGAWHGAWCWERFQEWFAAWGWESHAVDLRGHGDSPNDRSLRRTRIKHYAQDVAAAVRQLDRPPILVAHSMGALVAQRYLEDEVLPGAVLVTPVPLGGVIKATWRTLRRHPIAFLKANLMLDLGALVERAAVAADLFLPDDASEDEIAWLHERLQSESYLAYLDMLFFTRARPQLVHTPMAVLAAEHDRIFRPHHLRRLAQAYGTEVDVVPDTAHDLMLGPRWEQGAAAVANAIETIDAGSTDGR